ncbi:MAG TPA: hypothetical protein VFT43_14200 [Candidatus Polarisedimenticolia bacterium]|nr:hypothetical protein [Candidatus Polarisedimenticolia bacterium]
MSPVKRRRRLPTLINRGLGLLEVIFPLGSGGDDESCLPPGQRDRSGFWFPAGYGVPADIFTDEQRRLQAAQRRIQRHRRAAGAPPSLPPGGDGTMGMNESSGAAHSPPSRARQIQDPPIDPPESAELAVPLPSALSEAGAAASGTAHRTYSSTHAPRGRAERPSGVLAPEPPVVDSRRGSD